MSYHFDVALYSQTLCEKKHDESCIIIKHLSYHGWILPMSLRCPTR
jgi:hypothetical protein